MVSDSLRSRTLKCSFVSSPLALHLFFIKSVNYFYNQFCDYILYLSRGRLDLINWNVVYTATFSTYYFQWVGAVLSNVFEVFGWETADVFYVIFFAAWTVKNYIALHCDCWLELTEKS